MKSYLVIDKFDNRTVYQASDMRMALTVYEQVKGDEPVQIKLIEDLPI